MRNKLLLGLVCLLLINMATALEVNLLEPEPTYKITIEGSDIETIVLEASQSEIYQMINEVKEMNKIEKFMYFIEKFKLPFNLIIQFTGGLI